MAMPCGFVCLMLCFVWVYVDFCRFVRCASADQVYMCGLKGKLIRLFVLAQVFGLLLVLEPVVNGLFFDIGSIGPFP